MTIKDKVIKAKEMLKAMTSHKELTDWATSNGMDNRVAFTNFKKALKDIDIDYDGMRNESIAARAPKGATNKVVLYSDAKNRNNRFCICNEDRKAIWYGEFYHHPGEQSRSEMDAAQKAVWLAGKVKEREGLQVLKLELFVDAEWLVWANDWHANGGRSGGKARDLALAAEKAGIELCVEHIRGVDNPADYQTAQTYGFKKWQEGIKEIVVKSINNR